MRVCCGSRWGRCMLFTKILVSFMSPCLAYNTAMYTVSRHCGQYSQCMVHTLAGAWFIWTRKCWRQNASIFDLISFQKMPTHCPVIFPQLILLALILTREIGVHLEAIITPSAWQVLRSDIFKLLTLLYHTAGPARGVFSYTQLLP